MKHPVNIREIKRIPYIRRAAGILKTFLRAPEYFESIQKMLDVMGERTRRLEEKIDYIYEIERKVEVQNSLISSLEKNERKEHDALMKINQRVADLENPDANKIVKLTERICRNQEALQWINRETSTHPTIWGDTSRLFISEKASVFTCFFNTNSGSITIGDYTFAGSRVSILAGAHDPNLKNFLRRDTEIKTGCDIEIGNGVWLASGCMILGPCTIGDNAVIAAGAVVAPGTCVPPNTVFGGIPAKQIKTLELENNNWKEDTAVIRALQRNQGLLFVSGWKPKEPFFHTYIGYWLVDNGVIYTIRKYWKIMYYVPEGKPIELSITGQEGVIQLQTNDVRGEWEVALPCEDRELSELNVKKSNQQIQIMIAVLPM